MSATSPSGELNGGPWSPEELIAALRAQGARYHHLHPFHVRMNDGRADARGAAALGRQPLLLPAQHPDQGRGDPLELPRARGAPGVDPADPRPRRHRAQAAGGIESWLRLGEALGVDRETIASEELVLPGVRYSVDAYVNFCRTRPWVEAVRVVAHRAVRARARSAFGSRRSSFTTPGSIPPGLEYFRARLHQAPRDAQYALDLVVERCRTARAAAGGGRRARLQVRPALGPARGDRPRRHATAEARLGSLSREASRDGVRRPSRSPRACACTGTRSASGTCCSSRRARSR